MSKKMKLDEKEKEKEPDVEVPESMPSDLKKRYVENVRRMFLNSTPLDLRNTPRLHTVDERSGKRKLVFKTDPIDINLSFTDLCLLDVTPEDFIPAGAYEEANGSLSETRFTMNDMKLSASFKNCGAQKEVRFWKFLLFNRDLTEMGKVSLKTLFQSHGDWYNIYRPETHDRYLKLTNFDRSAENSATQRFNPSYHFPFGLLDFSNSSGIKLLASKLVTVRPGGGDDTDIIYANGKPVPLCDIVKRAEDAAKERNKATESSSSLFKEQFHFPLSITRRDGFCREGSFYMLFALYHNPESTTVDVKRDKPPKVTVSLTIECDVPVFPVWPCQ